MSAVPPSIKPAIGAANDTAEGVIDLAEDIFLFHPKPGGMVDEHRKRREREKLAAQERAQAAERVEERGYQAVKVTPLSPEIFATQTFVIQPGDKRMVLSLQPYRVRATITLIQPGETLDYTQCIVLAKDENNATSGVGAVIPPVTPMPFNSRAQLWAYNPLDVPIQLSVISELYSPET